MDTALFSAADCSCTSALPNANSLVQAKDLSLTANAHAQCARTRASHMSRDHTLDLFLVTKAVNT